MQHLSKPDIKKTTKISRLKVFRGLGSDKNIKRLIQMIIQILIKKTETKHWFLQLKYWILIMLKVPGGEPKFLTSFMSQMNQQWLNTQLSQ